MSHSPCQTAGYKRPIEIDTQARGMCDAGRGRNFCLQKFRGGLAGLVYLPLAWHQNQDHQGLENGIHGICNVLPREVVSACTAF